MRMFLVVIFASLFIIAYVWQNIEVVKLKMEYREKLHGVTRVVKENDWLRYRIERMKRMEFVRKAAAERGYVELRSGDMISIDMEGF